MAGDDSRYEAGMKVRRAVLGDAFLNLRCELPVLSANPVSGLRLQEQPVALIGPVDRGRGTDGRPELHRPSLPVEKARSIASS